MFSKMVILIPVYNPRERIINYVKMALMKIIMLFLKGWSMIVKSLIIHILKEKAML